MKKAIDIIHLPYESSKLHRPMNMSGRAAQFQPFQALTGYGEAILEMGRRVDKKPELTEEEKLIINGKLSNLMKKNTFPKVSVLLFVSDRKKEGGKVEERVLEIKRIDAYEHKIYLTNGFNIFFDDIIKLDILGEKDGEYI